MLGLNLIEHKFTFPEKKLYEPIGFLYVPTNRCCDTNYIVITETLHGVYSCECGCGCGWCTNGFMSMSEAIDAYYKMIKRYDLNKRNDNIISY